MVAVRLKTILILVAAFAIDSGGFAARAQTNSFAGDPVIEVLIQKGIITEAEAERVQADPPQDHCCASLTS